MEVKKITKGKETPGVQYLEENRKFKCNKSQIIDLK